MGKAGKILGSVVSVMLVVGVVIGVIAVVQRGNDKGGGGGGGTSTSTKTAAAICAPTQHKDACAASLQQVSSNPNASIQDYLSAALNATLVELKKAIDTTNKVSVDKDNDPHNDQMGVDDCKEFLHDAVDELQASINTVGDSELNTLQDRVHEFMSWLTSVYVYTTTCVDQLEKPEYKSPIQDGVLNSQQLTENALFIFSEIKNIAGSLNLNFSSIGDAAKSAVGDAAKSAGDTAKSAGDTAKSAASAAQRRLLDTDDEKGGNGGDEGYPNWVSPSDRRLLEHKNHDKGDKGGSGGGAPGGGAPAGVKPNAVVAKDGSGQFKTINDAINSIPKGGAPGGRFVIYVKAGIYNEIVLIKKLPNIFIYGDGQGKTIITGDLNVAIKKVKTSNSATIGVDADGFMIKSCTIRNTAGPDGHQAVALRIAGENAVVFDCAIEAFQDTLYYHRGKQFYKNCVISGTVDFIFGNGRALIQDSLIVARKPGPGQNNMITADGGLTPVGQHGVVLQNCKIVAEPELMAAKGQFKTFLGRPWKAYAVTIFMESDIGDFIAPEGYSIFTNVGDGSQNQNTAVYGEYQNTGPGANPNARNKAVFKKWRLLSPQEAQGYTAGAYLQGGAWLGNTGVPYKVGM